ncbi:hypothetical protein LFL96_25700 [Paraburkholderia sp. D15]|uniref:hypothetical protein n=1 Tax=Paraburkholderia sp. D15 TaxID=2880218 RepID=UPI00247AD784|nr:hypothetical protein [Paraburkholderia sp. D15]WGS54410.1 hypothetical protein LFL96_25700 [Paraburkholderia sp. D15]
MNSGNAEIGDMKRRLWLRAVYARAGVEDGYQMTVACREAGSYLSALEGLRWDRYEAGQLPQRRVVDMVNSVLTGTGSMFHEGPFDLPVWEVLEGNEKACLKQVDHFLDYHYKNAGEVRLAEPLKASWSFLHVQFAEVKPGEDWDLEDRFRKVTACFRTLQADLTVRHLKLDTNVYSLVFTEYQSSSDSEVPYSASSLLAAIAMWQLAIKCPVKSFREHAQYFLEGLNQGAIAYEFDEFGKDISEYMSVLLKNSGVVGKDNLLPLPMPGPRIGDKF